MDKKAIIENVKVFAVEQTYDDGRPSKVWTIGDKTDIGTIIEFIFNENKIWYAVSDTPSEWQKEQGQKNGWSWIFLLNEA